MILIKEAKDVIRSVKALRRVLKAARRDKEITAAEREDLKANFMAMVKEGLELFKLTGERLKEVEKIIERIEEVL